MASKGIVPTLHPAFDEFDPIECGKHLTSRINKFTNPAGLICYWRAGLDANTTRDADAAELAALYQRAEDAGKAFAAHMEAAMPLWEAVQAARAERDEFKRNFKAKHMGLKATNEKAA